MPNRKDLPFLLSLLEDDSTTVRDHVREALLSFGPALEKEVQPFQTTLDDYCREILEEIFQELHQHSYGGTWMSWVGKGDNKEELENALIGLAGLEFEGQEERIKDQLDDLAGEFLRSNHGCDIPSLMEFLFQEQGFRSPIDGEQNHLFDNLLYVLDHKEGSQVSLSCIAILVGYRVGIELDGISIQGNFMPISFEEHRMQMYNAFNKGRPLARASVMYIEEAFRRNQVPPGEMKAQVHEIVLQVLRNTIDILHRKNRHREAHEYVERYRALVEQLREAGIVE
ncbi:MAG: transglutaminase family protein [Bacteroidota bacterium]